MSTTDTRTAFSPVAHLAQALVSLERNDQDGYEADLLEAYDAAEREGDGAMMEGIEALPIEVWSTSLQDSAADGIRAILREELAL